MKRGYDTPPIADFGPERTEPERQTPEKKLAMDIIIASIHEIRRAKARLDSSSKARLDSSSPLTPREREQAVKTIQREARFLRCGTDSVGKQGMRYIWHELAGREGLSLLSEEEIIARVTKVTIPKGRKKRDDYSNSRWADG
jgi:hypothetical protein